MSTSMSAEIILHLANTDLAHSRGKVSAGIYPRVWDVMEARGARMRIVERGTAEMQGKPLAGDGNLHIVETGYCTGEGWFCGATAYLPGFWHLGDRGVLADSPARDAGFDPSDVPWREAKHFDRALRRELVDQRRSRYRQEKQTPEVMPEGSVAVFLQGPAVYRRHQAFVPAEAMLRAVAAGAGGRPVVVKAHPLAKEMGQAVIAKMQVEGLALIASQANVHDILSGCAVCVSVNSAVSFEGFLHRKPAILFGRSDFHMLAETVFDPADFSGALVRALATDWPYIKMLHWYFDRHTLRPDAPDFAEKLLAHFAKSGFDTARLGLRAPL
jgi:hypothetical protein